MKKKILLIGIVLILLTSIFTSAATYYVAKDGSGDFTSIQAAANAVSAGDTVIVQAGDYSSERVSVSTSGNAGAPISYQAQGTVVMKGFKITADYITVKDFEIANTDYRRYDRGLSACVYIKGNNVIVEDNYLHDCSLNGIFLYGTPEENTVTNNCIIRNNRIFRAETVGIDVNGRNNLIEGNEVWETVQCHPNLVAVEGPGCPNYGAPSGLDADGMRFFGQGHIFRRNYIHDIPLGPPGVNPAIEDYNDEPHVDCWQHWSGTYYEVASNLLFEQNYCDITTAYSAGQGWYCDYNGVDRPSNITLRNNILKVFRTVNAIGIDDLTVVSNTFLNDLSFDATKHPGGIQIKDSTNAVVKNNILYDMLNHPVCLSGSGYESAQTGGNLEYRSDGQALWINDDWCHYTADRRANDLWGVDPKFVNHAAGDYHLQSDSPAIDAGFDLTGLLNNDYDDNSRPQGSGYDIGAYEQEGGSSGPRTYYVSTSGSDSNSGTSSQPWRTIQKAADTIGTGDTVIVNAGTYNEQVTLTTSGSSGAQITFQANGNVVMHGFQVFADYITIKNFDIRDTPTCHWRQGWGIFAEGSNLIIEDNYLYNNCAGGINLRTEADDLTKSSNCIVRNNRAHRNGMVGIEIGGTNNLVENNEVWETVEHHPTWEGLAPDWTDADGFRFFGTGHIFRGNYIHDISYDDPLNINAHIDCFQTWSGTDVRAGQNILFEKNFCDVPSSNAIRENGHGFMLEDARDITIKNNIIRSFGGVNSGGGDNDNIIIVNNHFISNLAYLLDRNPTSIGLANVPTVIVKNNIIYDQPAHSIYRTGTTSGHDISNNLIYRSDGQSPWTPAYPNDVYMQDPKFVNPGNDDFRLQSTSPAIDAGASVSGVTDDYDGVNRPQGSGYDIGAFEFEGTPPPPDVLPGLSWEAEDGVITPPFSITSGYVHQVIETDPASGGKASYRFNIENAGDYIIKTIINAPNTGANSFFINIDSEPTSPNMVWDIIELTNGFEERTVSWRGSGTPDNNEFVPKVFTLAIGEHELIIRGREGNTLLNSIALEPYEPIEGDLNNNGAVEIGDLIIVASNFGLSNGFDQRADTDKNGVIDIFDIVFVASRFT